MSRLIITFSTLFKTLQAEKILRAQISCRPTPTPPGLSSDICAVSVELLDQNKRGQALALLEKEGLTPSGIHEIS
jgi:hypothetical protein